MAAALLCCAAAAALSSSSFRACVCLCVWRQLLGVWLPGLAGLVGVCISESCALRGPVCAFGHGDSDADVRAASFGTVV